MSGEACDSIRSHLARGAPWEACDAFREAIANHPEDAELLYWGALAHARAGAGSRAHSLLDEAQKSPQSSSRLADILSLRGRLWKDAFTHAPSILRGRPSCSVRATSIWLPIRWRA